MPPRKTAEAPASRHKSVAIDSDGDVMIETVWAEFTKMRILHPRLKQVRRYFDALRGESKLAPSQPRGYVTVFAPTGSGKSTAVKSYIEKIVVPELVAEGLYSEDTPALEVALDQKRVVHVTLSARSSLSTLALDILTALGDKRADKGHPDIRIARCYRTIQKLKVQLLIIDELQHLSHAQTDESLDGTREKTAVSTPTDVADTLKAMLIKGLVPMCFVGIELAESILQADGQLLGRRRRSLDFSKLRWHVPEERKIFEDYCIAVGLKIFDHQLVEEEPDFSAMAIPHHLWAATGGVIGGVSRLAEEATIHALERKDGPRTVTFQDLALAVETRGIPNGISEYNPFREGIRREKRVAA